MHVRKNKKLQLTEHKSKSNRKWVIKMLEETILAKEPTSLASKSITFWTALEVATIFFKEK